MAEKKGRLGGASAALMGRRGAEALASLATEAEAGLTELANAVQIDITRIQPNPNQPRKTVDPEALKELAASVAEKGILQPIVVRRHGDGFVIVAGERRYRAAQLVGLPRLPAMIREATDDEAIEQSLIENLQRENIDPIEESTSFRQLMQAHGYSLRDLAARLHKSHAYIAERLQLTRHPDIAEAVAAGTVSPKAASELARVEDETLRKQLTGRVQRGEIDSRHIRQAKRGDMAPQPVERKKEPAEAVVGTIPPVRQPVDTLTQAEAMDAQGHESAGGTTGRETATLIQQASVETEPARTTAVDIMRQPLSSDVALESLAAAEAALDTFDISQKFLDLTAVRRRLEALSARIRELLSALE